MKYKGRRQSTNVVDLRPADGKKKVVTVREPKGAVTMIVRGANAQGYDATFDRRVAKAKKAGQSTRDATVSGAQRAAVRAKTRALKAKGK
jgi:hypothetical protein